ncbi:hypothetical protein ACWGNE_01010 [Streptomyces xiamenensis]|uniref:hypothetical protein n=1 Tax=Streptomyces xiamenensis TaxID=408015 RepID=UPI0036C028C7
MATQRLVGFRLADVVGSHHEYGEHAPVGPLDVWLIGDFGVTVHVTTGSDGCLIVEETKPHTGYDMGAAGRVTVGMISRRAPFRDHIGESILAVQDEHSPNIGRVAMELSFPTGRVRCESWAGDLCLTSAP